MALYRASTFITGREHNCDKMALLGPLQVGSGKKKQLSFSEGSGSDVISGGNDCVSSFKDGKKKVLP
jgi:hypothetical protein